MLLGHKGIVSYYAPINIKSHYHIYRLRLGKGGMVGESTTNLPTGSGDLSLCITQCLLLFLTNTGLSKYLGHQELLGDQVHVT